LALIGRIYSQTEHMSYINELLKELISRVI